MATICSTKSKYLMTFQCPDDGFSDGEEKRDKSKLLGIRASAKNANVNEQSLDSELLVFGVFLRFLYSIR